MSEAATGSPWSAACFCAQRHSQSTQSTSAGERVRLTIAPPRQSEPNRTLARWSSSKSASVSAARGSRPAVGIAPTLPSDDVSTRTFVASSSPARAVASGTPAAPRIAAMIV